MTGHVVSYLSKGTAGRRCPALVILKSLFDSFESYTVSHRFCFSSQIGWSDRVA